MLPPSFLGKINILITSRVSSSLSQYSRLGKPAKFAIFFVGPALAFGRYCFGFSITRGKTQLYDEWMAVWY